ncbi:MAG: endonuclease/exonuclease/phosphatase family protein [Anaerolineae bacterium]|nr:endonuclease/exonuclease/phosphatase family protein [Anaerolineae bacterium]
MTSLTVATVNINHRNDRWGERRHLLVAEILDHMPDLIALQDVAILRRQGHWLRAQVNMRIGRSRREPYRLVQQRRTSGDLFAGVAILSRLPLLSSDGYALGEGDVALRANVLLPDGQALDFATTRLRSGAALPETREEQAMRLVGWLNAIGRVPLQVIAGDFNETPGGPAPEKMRQQYRSAFALAHGHEPLATYPTALAPAGILAQCLDYVFVSRGISVTQAEIICRRAAAEDDTLYPSSHVGLLVTLELHEN